MLDDPATADFIVADLTRDLDEQPHADSPLPTIGARLALIEACAPTGGSLGGALSLHRPAGAVEEAALRASDRSASGVLVEIAWDRVAEAVWLPRMRGEVAPWHDALEGCTVADLRSLVQRDDVPLPVLGAALAVTLHEHGWELRMGPDAALRAASDTASVPMLGVGDEVPNVLLVFSEPVRLPRRRRRSGGCRSADVR